MSARPPLFRVIPAYWSEEEGFYEEADAPSAYPRESALEAIRSIVWMATPDDDEAADE